MAEISDFRDWAKSYLSAPQIQRKANATMTVNGITVISGTPSGAIPLTVGITPFIILVTAHRPFAKSGFPYPDWTMERR